MTFADRRTATKAAPLQMILVRRDMLFAPVRLDRGRPLTLLFWQPMHRFCNGFVTARCDQCVSLQLVVALVVS